MSNRRRDRRTPLQHKAESIASRVADREWRESGMLSAPDWHLTWLRIYDLVIWETGALS